MHLFGIGLWLKPSKQLSALFVVEKDHRSALAIGLAGVDFLNAPEIAHRQIACTRERAEFTVMAAGTQCNVVLENPFIGIISAVCTVVGSPIGKIHINISGNPAMRFIPKPNIDRLFSREHFF